MIWSDEESEEREEPFNKVMVLVSLATTEYHHACVVADVISSPGAVVESSDDAEVVHSYRVMYKKLVTSLSENQELRKQVFLLSNEKEDLDNNAICSETRCANRKSLFAN